MLEIPCPRCLGREDNIFEISCPVCNGSSRDSEEDKPLKQCHECGGEGLVEIETCPDCLGTGTVLASDPEDEYEGVDDIENLKDEDDDDQCDDDDKMEDDEW